MRYVIEGCRSDGEKGKATATILEADKEAIFHNHGTNKALFVSSQMSWDDLRTLLPECLVGIHHQD